MTSIEMSNNTDGEIITFYSYKGGTGRTMALSNVACILAKQSTDHKGVLMIDWDLEAPGLHRFFFQEKFYPTGLPLKDITNPSAAVEERPGLIDLFLELASASYSSDSKENEMVAMDAINRVNLDQFIVKTYVPNLSLLKAGCFDEKYSDKVNTFNWEQLYNRSPFLIRLFAERLAERYEYVLIDSRTGYTDISGICTMLMPQKLVVVFTPNRQSYTGIKGLIKRATKYRRRSDDLRPLLVYPLPSRIEFSRDDLRAYWRFGNVEQRITGYQPMFEDIFKEVYGLDECNLSKYFEEVQIQQSPNYAYGEGIAVIDEKTKDSFSLSRSYEIFTNWLVNSIAPWQRTESEMDEPLAKMTKEKMYVRARSLYDSKRFARSVEYADYALSIDPSYVDAWNQKGFCLNALGKHREAIECFEKVLAIDPDNDIAIQSKAHSLNALGSYIPAQFKQEKQQKEEDKPLQLLKLLQEGKIEEFNRKRKEENYSHLSFQNVDLAGKNISGADVRDVDFSGAKLVDVNLRMANLTGAKLKGVQLSGADLRDADLRGMVDFTGANLTGANLTGANLDGIINFDGAILYDVDFSGAKIDTGMINFNNAKIRNAIGLSLSSATDLSVEQEQYDKRLAIIVGVNEYQQSDIPTLAGPENDAIEVYEQFKRNGGFDVSPNHLLIGRDATRAKILKAFGEIFNRKDVECDLVAFYCSGHIMVDEDNEEYIAPYDMDPEDPYVTGINMEDLRNFIYKSKNKASIIMFFDCCYAEINKDAKPGTTTLLADPETKKLYAHSLQKMVESPDTFGTEHAEHGRGNIIFASSEATVVSRERNNCKHRGNDEPHTHGAFTFHLIKGLDGEAANPDTGVITIEGLRRYIENQMLAEGRQRPMYYVAEASRIDSIKLAISEQRFNAKITQIIKGVDDLLEIKYPNSDLIDIQFLADAAKRVDELITLDPNNSEIPRLQKAIDEATKAYLEPTINWLSRNFPFARRKINEIEYGLYDRKLPTLIQSLSFNDLQKIDHTKLMMLMHLSNEVARNTQFTSEEDPRLRMFQAKLRSSLQIGRL